MKNLMKLMAIGAIDTRVRTNRGRTAAEKRAFGIQMSNEREAHCYYHQNMANKPFSAVIGDVTHIQRPLNPKDDKAYRYDRTTRTWVEL